jgi:hypothetical protein
MGDLRGPAAVSADVKLRHGCMQLLRCRAPGGLRSTEEMPLLSCPEGQRGNDLPTGNTDYLSVGRGFKTTNGLKGSMLARSPRARPGMVINPDLLGETSEKQMPARYSEV